MFPRVCSSHTRTHVYMHVCCMRVLYVCVMYFLFFFKKNICYCVKFWICVICMFACAYVYMYVRTYICMYVMYSMYVYMYVSMCVYIYVRAWFIRNDDEFLQRYAPVFLDEKGRNKKENKDQNIIERHQIRISYHIVWLQLTVWIHTIINGKLTNIW